jgi:hypothetical protein
MGLEKRRIEDRFPTRVEFRLLDSVEPSLLYNRYWGFLRGDKMAGGLR